MAHRSITASILVIISVSVLEGCTQQETPRNTTPSTGAVVDHQKEMHAGAALFKQFCSNCHPDGGNVSDPDRTLHGSALQAHHITTPDDIIRIMRNPVSRMITFDTTAIPDRDARIIANYVLETFK